MHINSLLAYYADIRKFNKREKLIYGHLTMLDRPATDREVKDILFGFTSDMNACRPRISDLIRKGWLVEVDKVKDRVTGKRVRRVRAVSAEEKQRNEHGELVQEVML